MLELPPNEISNTTPLRYLQTHKTTSCSCPLLLQGIEFEPSDDINEDSYILEQIESLSQRHHKVSDS